MSEDVQEVTAEVIDAPSVRTQLDAAVAEVEGKAATARERYMPREVKDGEDYRQLKRDRSALRREWRAGEDQRKALLGEAKRAIRDAELRFAPAMDEYKALDAEIKGELDEWRDHMDAEKMAAVQDFYNDLAPNLVPLVPLSKLDDVYGKANKWHAETTGAGKVEQDVADAVEQIAKDEQAIDAMGYDEQDARAFKAYYFESLDFGDAARRAQADREQRLMVEALEQERQERAAMAARASESAEKAPKPEDTTGRADDGREGQEAAHRPSGVNVAQETADAMAQPDPADEVPPIAFMAYVTEAQRSGLVAYCKRNDIHGSFRATHGRRMRLAERGE